MSEHDSLEYIKLGERLVSGDSHSNIGFFSLCGRTSLCFLDGLTSLIMHWLSYELHFICP